MTPGRAAGLLRRAATGTSPAARVAALLATEFLGVSVFIELPAEGPALAVVGPTRLLIPVVVGGAAAAGLMRRHGPRDAGDPLPAPGPGWRRAALVAHLLAFAFTAAYGVRLLGPGAPPASLAAFCLWLAGGGATVGFAAFTVASPAALLRRGASRWGVPLLAICAGVASWRAVATAKALWEPLRASTLAASAAVLRVWSPDVRVAPDESVIAVGDFSVEIAPECSGVDGLGLVLVFLALWLSLARGSIRPLRAALVLAPVGVVVALAANTVRIAALVALGASGHEALAVGAFHSKAGWVLFLAIVFALIAAAEHLPWLQRAPAAGAPASGPPLPAALGAHVAPLVVTMATALVTTSLSSEAFDRWYGARVLAGLAALVAVRRGLPRLSPFPLSFLPLAIGGAVALLWISAAGARPAPPPAALGALDATARALWIAVRLAGACVVIPLVEELAFRGFILPWLASADLDPRWDRAATWAAVVVSSLAFGLVHERFLLGAIAGVAFALARLWRGRLSDAVVAHAAANTGIAAAVLLGGRWELWP